jgi:DHA2 family multidrug resistance protein-like MFS transporter
MINADSRRWWALGALALSVLVVNLDLTVLNLALPSLATALHASTGDLQWFIDGYSLVLAAALLPAGLLGDRIGRKKVLAGALALFGVASLACAYAGSVGELIAARAVLGLAAAAILPLVLGVIPVMFSPAERSKAIALVGGATFAGYPVGPLLGGWLLDHFWWGSVFLINVPVVLLAVAAVAALMPESRSQQRPALDLLGVVLSSAALAGLTYGVITAGQQGWGSRPAVFGLVGGAVVMVLFVGWEIRLQRAGRQPLADLTLFRSASFTWGTGLSTLISFALFGILFGIPQYFRDVQGLDAFGSGVRLLPLMGGLAVGLIGGQRLQGLAAGRDGDGGGTGGGSGAGAGSGAGRGGGRVSGAVLSAKGLVTGGLMIMAVALAVGAGTSVGSSSAFGAAWLAAAGLGLGLALPVALNGALSALSPERSGSGSALMTALRQVGATFGVAVLGTVLSAVYRSGVPVTRLPGAAAGAVRDSVAGGAAVAHSAGSAPLLALVRGAYVHGLDVMLWTCAGIALVSAGLALAFLPRRAAGPGAAGPGAAAAGADSASAVTAGAARAE